MDLKLSTNIQTDKFLQIKYIKKLFQFDLRYSYIKLA
jgi:hypothetical protein